MEGRTATIAIGQMRSTNDKELNRRQVHEIVQLAVQQKANVCIHHTSHQQSIQRF